MGLAADRSYDAVITGHEIKKTMKGTGYVAIYCNAMTDEGEIPATCKVWISPKTIEKAQSQLRQCGFDPVVQNLNLLNEQQQLLAGNPIQLETKDAGKYGIQAEITIPNKATHDEIDSFAKMLKGGNKGGKNSTATESKDLFAPEPEAAPDPIPHDPGAASGDAIPF